MRRLALNVAVILSLLLCGAQAAPAKDTWTSVRSKNFFLIGNASEKDIRHVATRLEQFRHVFSRIFKRARLSDGVPTTVVVFKNANAYKPFNPGGYAGYFQPGEDVNYITLNADRSGADDPYAIIFHEYMHLLVRNNISANTPAWLSEGLAEFYSTLEVHKDEKKADVGKPLSHHVYYLREQKLLPLSTLFSVDHSSPHYNERSKRGVFYAQSWALVHYLMLGKERQRQPQLVKYLNLVGSGAKPEESFRAAFGGDVPAIEKELRDYIRGDRYPYVTFNLEERVEFDSELQSAAISEADALAYLGDLALHSPHMLEQAETHLQKAIALDATNVMAQSSLGMLRMRQRRFAEAKEHLRRAVAADARNHLAHYYYAYTLSREGMNEGSLISGYAPQVAGEMRAALRKAIELKPSFVSSYDLLAFINLVTGEQLDEGIDLLKRALGLTPGNDNFKLNLAQLYLRKQDLDSARKVVEPLAQSSPDPRVRASAQSLLSSITSFQRQTSDLENMSEAEETDDSASEDEQPRLKMRDDLNEASAVGMTAEEAMAQALREALRKPLAGEARARGVLTRMDCTAKSVTFHVRVGERVLKFQTDSPEGLHIAAFTPEAGRQLTCGPRQPESHVVVTYRAPSDAKAKTNGVLVALEFVPEKFELKQ